jgi:hypothetical protein
MLKNLIAIAFMLFLNPGDRPKPVPPIVLTIPPDRPVPPTIGFFIDGWQPKTFVVPPFDPVAAPAMATSSAGPAATPNPATPNPATSVATLFIDADSVITRIPLSEFSHNVDFWIGAMATQPTFLSNVTNLDPHFLRWPGGSASDAYFWNRAPGQWPADVPDLLPDADGKKKATRLNYGRPTTDRISSVDDYYAMLKATGSQGLITVNYGYARYGTTPNPVAAAAHLAADWVRYDHGRTRYWEIGNENNGFWEYGYRIDTTMNKDGQPKLLTGDLYGRHFRVFADSMRKAAAETGATIYIGAVTGEAPPKPWDLPIMRNWNAGMMKAIHDQADFYVVHSYFTPYNQNTSAHDILYDAATAPGHIMDYVRQCLRDNGASIKPIAMDEWNMFAVGSRQQVSNISGLFGVIVIGEALRNKFGLAARWDLSNAWAGGNDHGLFSAGDQPGIARWSPRPSFYYLYYLQRTMGDRLLEAHVRGDTSIKAYASRFSSGELGAALVNTDTIAATVTIDTRHFPTESQTPAQRPHSRQTPGRDAAGHPFGGRPAGRLYYWYSLQGGDDNGDFSGKVFVNGEGPAGSAGGPSDDATLKANATPAARGIRVTIPARGAVFLVIAK